MAIKVGDIIEGDIIDFSHEGNGVLKIGDLIVFTSNGLIGDRVRVKIEQIKKNYAMGRVIKIIEPSKDRVEGDLDLTKSKGGIPLIHYKYSKQLEWKRNKVKSDLERIAGLKDVKVMETIGMDDPFRYRNHVQIPVGSKDGKAVIGFYKLASNNIIDMDSSILQPEIGDRIIKIIRNWMAKYDISPYNKRTRKGILCHIGIRTNKDKQAMVILVLGTNNLPRKKELIEMLKVEDIISIYININKLNSSITYGKQYRKIYGEDRIIDYIGDYKFYLSPNSFFQVNRIQAQVLYNKTKEYLELDKEDIIYDLYSGIGTISLYIARNAKKVYGVEIVEQAIADANKNAIINNIDNVEFKLGKSEDIFPSMMKEGIIGNKVVLDPPRKGCEKEVLESIIQLGPERVVYVSCNPSTMARDLKYLVENGYRVVEVQPVDMFPHTAHVECIALIQKKTI